MKNVLLIERMKTSYPLEFDLFLIEGNHIKKKLGSIHEGNFTTKKEYIEFQLFGNEFIDPTQIDAVFSYIETSFFPLGGPHHE